MMIKDNIHLMICSMPTDAQQRLLARLSPTWVVDGKEKSKTIFQPNVLDRKWVALRRRLLRDLARVRTKHTTDDVLDYGAEGDPYSALISRLNSGSDGFPLFPSGLIIRIDCTSWGGRDALTGSIEYNAFPCRMPVALSSLESLYYGLLLDQFKANRNANTLFLTLQVVRALGGDDPTQPHMRNRELHSLIVVVTKNRNEVRLVDANGEGEDGKERKEEKKKQIKMESHVSLVGAI